MTKAILVKITATFHTEETKQQAIQELKKHYDNVTDLEVKSISLVEFNADMYANVTIHTDYEEFAEEIAKLLKPFKYAELYVDIWDNVISRSFEPQ